MVTTLTVLTVLTILTIGGFRDDAQHGVNWCLTSVKCTPELIFEINVAIAHVVDEFWENWRC